VAVAAPNTVVSHASRERFTLEWVSKGGLLAGMVAALFVATATASSGSAGSGATGTLAFTRYVPTTRQIWVVRADGADPHRLIGSSLVEEDPAWSPNGTKLAFIRDARGDTCQVAPSGDPICQWPSGDRNQTAAIFVVSADGGDLTQITPYLPFLSSPAWSPDGTRIAYSATLPGRYFPTPHIFIVGLARGSTPQRVTALPEVSTTPIWFPNGKALLVTRGEGEAELVKIPLTTGQQTQVIADTKSLSPDPAISTDGTRIAWSQESGHYHDDLWVANADGSDARIVVTGSQGNVIDPAFSPDGSHIAFVRATGDPDAGSIWTVETNGTNPVRVTPAGWWDETPSWRE